MLEGIPCQCPIIKDIIKDVSVGQVLKGLLLLHLILWLLTVFSSLVLSGSGGGILHIDNKGVSVILERIDRLECLRGSPNNAI